METLWRKTKQVEPDVVRGGDVVRRGERVAASPAWGQDWPWAWGYRPVQAPLPLSFTPEPPPFQLSPAGPLPPDPWVDRTISFA